MIPKSIGEGETDTSVSRFLTSIVAHFDDILTLTSGTCVFVQEQNY